MIFRNWTAFCPVWETLRKQNYRMVFTNGCFDLLHVGHVKYLEEAKKLGDVLIVGVNTDASVRAIKGPQRPIVPDWARAQVLSHLKSVDYVILFHEPNPLKLIKAIQPHVLVKGDDWPLDQIVGADFVQSYGGKVLTIALEPGFSTTALIEKILKTSSKWPVENQS